MGAHEQTLVRPVRAHGPAGADADLPAQPLPGLGHGLVGEVDGLKASTEAAVRGSHMRGALRNAAEG